MKLRTKLALLVTAVATVPFAVTVIVTYVDSRTRTAAEVQRIAAFRAVQQWLHTEVGPGWQQVLRSDPAAAALLPPAGHAVAVVDAEGMVVLSNIAGVDPGAGPLRLTELAAELRAPGVRVTTHPVFAEGLSVGAAVEVSAVPTTLWGRAGRILRNGRYGLVSLIIIGGATVWLLARSLRRSLARLETAAARIAAGDLQFTLDATGRDEVAAVARSFDRMREALMRERTVLAAERRRKTEFLVAVSHDMRTPLTSIRGYLEAVLDGVAADRAAEHRYLQIARERVDLLEDRIGELSALLRMETGGWELQLVGRSLARALSELADGYREDVLVLQREYRCSIDVPVAVQVSADWSLVARVTDNLIHNALRYTRRGDTIGFAARLQDGAAWIDFSDTGPGIPRAQLEQVFEPFYRGSPSRREPGSGLGLSIARSIARAHGWNLAAVPANQGTCIRLVIPAALLSQPSAAQLEVDRVGRT